MRNDKENIIVNKTFDFALNIIEFSEDLYEAKKFPLANQILCLKSPHLKSPNEKLISDLREILLILSKIISSSKLK